MSLFFKASPWQVDLTSWTPRDYYYTIDPNHPEYNNNPITTTTTTTINTASSSSKNDNNNNINVTPANTYHCITCGDFTEIDTFAQLLTLSNLSTLRYGTLKEHSQWAKADTSLRLADARSLFVSLFALRKAYPDWTSTKTAPLDFEDITLGQLWDSLAISNAMFSDKLAAKPPVDEELARKLAKTQPGLDAATAAKFEEPRSVEKDLAVEKILDEREAMRAEHREDRAVYEERGQHVFSELGKWLWESFCTLRYSPLDERYKRMQTDNVAKARLFSTWVALSITYNNDILASVKVSTSDLSKSTDSMRAGAMLSTRTEICKFYVNSVMWMFNGVDLGRTVPDPHTPGARIPVSKVVYVSGVARDQIGGVNAVPFPTRSLGGAGHGWLAFPLHEAATDNEYKLIDPTWMAAKHLSGLRTRWWSRPNEAFQFSHFPHNPAHLYLPPISHELAPNRETWWSLTLPLYPWEGMRHTDYLNQGTITRVTDPNNGSVSVQFRTVCKHQTPPTRFYLGIVKPGPELNCPVVVEDGPRVEFTDRGRGNWEAELASVPANNSVAILAGIGETTMSKILPSALVKKFDVVVAWSDGLKAAKK